MERASDNIQQAKTIASTHYHRKQPSDSSPPSPHCTAALACNLNHHDGLMETRSWYLCCPAFKALNLKALHERRR
eukprot:3822658-Rhodomonas_salina.1